MGILQRRLSFVPADSSGDLNILAKGSGFWFLLRDTAQFSMSENLQLSPLGSVGNELIIGGATTLLPPSQGQVSPNISRVALSRYSTISANSTQSSNNTSSLHVILRIPAK